jgi:hypothetical protein
MKVRIKGNSLRLRVSRSEVEGLLFTGRIEETIWLGLEPSSRLTFALELNEAASAMALRAALPEIAIVVPTKEAWEWRNTEQVGIYATAAHGLRGPLELLVEKDFACLDRSDEENSNTFPHPMAGAQC